MAMIDEEFFAVWPRCFGNGVWLSTIWWACCSTSLRETEASISEEAQKFHIKHGHKTSFATSDTATTTDTATTDTADTADTTGTAIATDTAMMASRMQRSIWHVHPPLAF